MIRKTTQNVNFSRASEDADAKENNYMEYITDRAIGQEIEQLAYEDDPLHIVRVLEKEEGRLGGAFCTTHGTPAYIRTLIDSDAFDAVMMAYNPLGFHLLSYSSPQHREQENLERNQVEIFPHARVRDIGLMIMKPLGPAFHSSASRFCSATLSSFGIAGNA